MKSFLSSFLLSSLMLVVAFPLQAQQPAIPKVFSNIQYDKNGVLNVETRGLKGEEAVINSLRLQDVMPSIEGTKSGFKFRFADKKFQGTMNYGFVPYGDSRHPQPVLFKVPLPVKDGVATLDMRIMKGKYDMIDWTETGHGVIGYRVFDAEGKVLYDGKFGFKGKGPFAKDVSLIDGPTVNMVSSEGAMISFTTDEPVAAEVRVGDLVFSTKKEATRHEFALSGLQPATAYTYSIQYGPEDHHQQSYAFTTAPAPGSRTAFTFAYASDSRSGQGGGERDIYGANAYIMKKIMALATQQGAAFFQFSGDLIDGYLTDTESMRLQYRNWKAAIQPFAHYLPIYISMGNHEALGRLFLGKKGRVSVDRFPFETESAEAIFAQEFVNPLNGPESEDGAEYDPDSNAVDFPSYKENVFYYTYDNVAVVVLNSDYLYTPNHQAIPFVGGGLHGYIMDQQLAWLEESLEKLEADENIDHIFLTLHTPFFPNGGHVKDDMWYSGNNQHRPFIAGKPLSKGIIERRDQLLDLLANQSEKALAILTGDEHNFALTTLTGETEIYPELFLAEKIKLSRTLYQVNNGAAGAPYYAQEQTPWSDAVEGFTTQNALVLFHVEGNSVEMEVLNPDTLEEIMRKKLR